MVGAIADRSPAAGPAAGPVRLGRLGRRHRPVLPRRQQLALRRGDDDHRRRSAWAPASSSTTPSCAASPAPTTATRSPAAAGRWATSAAACSSRINLVIVTKPDLDRGRHRDLAVRISLLSAGLWWAVFTLIPVIGLWSLRGNAVERARRPAAGVVRRQPGPARPHLPRPAQLPEHHAVPARLPVLQRRHPDRHHLEQPLRRRAAGLRREPADRADPARAVRRVRRCPALRLVRRALGRVAHHPALAHRLVAHRRRRVLPARRGASCPSSCSACSSASCSAAARR